MDLMTSMFQFDPDRRPAAHTVLDHPYFTDEEPAAEAASNLAALEGDWHEFESKAARKENDKKEKEREREKRRTMAVVPPSTGSEPAVKRVKAS